MTPDEACDLLDGTTPGPWEVDDDHAWAPGVWSPEGIVFGPYYDREDMEQWEAGSAADLRLAAAAPTLAALAAGMRPEYRAEQQVHVGVWLPICGWYDHYTAQFFATVVGEGVTRVVRRYATTPEEA